jgi:hypothetical protein
MFWVNWLLGHSVFWLKEHALDGFQKILATIRKQKNFHLIRRDKIMQDAPTVFQEMMNFEYCNTWHIFIVHVSHYMHTKLHDKVLSLESMNKGTLRKGSISLSHIYILSFPSHAEGDSHNELLTMDTDRILHFWSRYHVITQHILHPYCYACSLNNFCLDFSILVVETHYIRNWKLHSLHIHILGEGE